MTFARPCHQPGPESMRGGFPGHARLIQTSTPYIRPLISVLILTLDEERNIGDCLDSVSWADDVLVLDSRSTDRGDWLPRDSNARPKLHILNRPTC